MTGPLRRLCMYNPTNPWPAVYLPVVQLMYMLCATINILHVYRRRAYSIIRTIGVERSRLFVYASGLS